MHNMLVRDCTCPFQITQYTHTLCSHIPIHVHTHTHTHTHLCSHIPIQHVHIHTHTHTHIVLLHNIQHAQTHTLYSHIPVQYLHKHTHKNSLSPSHTHTHYTHTHTHTLTTTWVSPRTFFSASTPSSTRVGGRGEWPGLVGSGGRGVESGGGTKPSGFESQDSSMDFRCPRQSCSDRQAACKQGSTMAKGENTERGKCPQGLSPDQEEPRSRYPTSDC